MPNQLYPLGKNALLGSLDVSTANLKVVLVDAGAYTYSSAHQFLSDIAAGARIATSGNLANKTISNGVFDADDITFTAVSGVQSEALVIYEDTGSAATSRLVAYIDSATGLPVTPNGGNILITWDNGSNKIFAI
ncbi:MAG: hypothetical protein SFY66_19870 [Oculatellaceae cyanobacterium bins.114]|nr:hypothetical protein [Oculatellaceae cyanobacterium bins.114]